MSKMDDIMNEKFHLMGNEQLQPEEENESIEAELIDDVETSNITEQQIEQDFSEARKSIDDTIKLGEQALQHLFHIAQDDDKARTFEVFSTLMGQIVTANKEKINLHTDKQKALNSDGKESTKKTINNNLIVTTTANELLKTQLKKRKEKENNE